MALSPFIRQKVLPILALGFFGSIATGCTLFGANTTTNTSATKKQVRVWRLDQSIDTVRGEIDDFQSNNKNVTLTYQKRSIDGYELGALRSMAGRQGPDVWSIPNDWLADEQPILAPLPDNYYFNEKTKKSTPPVEKVKTLYPQGIWEQLISNDGKSVMGVPSTVDTLHLYYNPDVFSSALNEYRKGDGQTATDEARGAVTKLLTRPPATWNDLIEMSKYITRRSGSTINRATIALGTADNITDSEDILLWMMMQNGATIISTDRKNALFHIPDTTAGGGQIRPGGKALDFYTSFADPSKANYTWNSSMPSLVDAFGQGKVAMVISFTGFGGKVKVAYPKLSFEKGAVPQIALTQPATNLLKFSVEAVTQTADSSSLGFAFMKKYTEGGTLSGLAKEAKLSSPYITALTDKNDYFVNQILTGKAVYRKNHDQFDEVFREMINNVNRNGLSTEDALVLGADKVNQILNPKPSDK